MLVPFYLVAYSTSPAFPLLSSPNTCLLSNLIFTPPPAAAVLASYLRGYVVGVSFLYWTDCLENSRPILNWLP